MKRRQFLVSSGAVATAALAGCTGSAQTNTDGERRTLTVSKSGEASAAPDLAIIHVSIEATGEDPSTVRDELSTRSQQLTDGLLASGLSEDAVTTDQFSIHEDRRRRREPTEGPEPAETTRYEGSHSFRIEVDDVESVGSVVDTAVESGADRIEHIEFTLSEERRAELREDALQSAIEAARNESEFVAEEVDKSVLDVQRVDTSEGRIEPVRQEFAAQETADSSQATELQPDDVTVRAAAKITYEME